MTTSTDSEKVEEGNLSQLHLTDLPKLDGELSLSSLGNKKKGRPYDSLGNI